MGRRGALAAALVAAGALAATSTASAATWKRLGTSTTTTVASAGSSVVYDFVAADGTGFGPALSLVGCADATAQFDPDVASTAGAGRVYLYSCVSTPPTANVCGKILVDNDNDGLPNDAPMSGVDGTGGVAPYRYVYDIGGIPYLAPYVFVAADGVTRPRLLVTCEDQ